MRRIRRRARAQRMDPLAVRLQDPRDRVLGSQSISRSAGALAARQRDHDVALGVAQPDGRGDVQRATPPREAARPGLRPTAFIVGRLDRPDEVAQKQVDLDRVARIRDVTATRDPRDAGAGDRAAARANPRPGPVTASPSPCTTSVQETRAHIARVCASSGSLSPTMSVSASVFAPQPTASSVGFVECGSVKQRLKKNSRNPG